MLICFEFNLASVICMLIKKKLGKAEKKIREKKTRIPHCLYPKIITIKSKLFVNLDRKNILLLKFCVSFNNKTQ